MKDENELLKQLEKTLCDFSNYEKPIITNNGDILIKNTTNISKRYKKKQGLK